MVLLGWEDEACWRLISVIKALKSRVIAPQQNVDPEGSAVGAIFKLDITWIRPLKAQSVSFSEILMQVNGLQFSQCHILVTTRLNSPDLRLATFSFLYINICQ